MHNLELITEGLKRLNENQDTMLEKLNAIHIQTTQTNGRVTAVEKENAAIWRETSKIWKVLKYGGIVLAVILLVLVSKGIISPSDLPKP